MAKLTCKCLNVKIHTASSIQDVPNTSAAAFGTLQHPFFKQSLSSENLASEGFQIEQPSLLYVETADSWMIYKCLGCNTFTHAVNLHSDRQVLLNRATLEDEQLVADRLSCSPSYSSLYRIVLRDDSETSYISDLENVSKDDVLKQYIDQIEQQLSQYLSREESSMLERVSQFEESLKSSFGALRTKACHDRNCLLKLLLTSQVNRQPATPLSTVTHSQQAPAIVEKADSSKQTSLSLERQNLTLTKPENKAVADIFDSDPMFANETLGPAAHYSDDDDSTENDNDYSSDAEEDAVFQSNLATLDLLSTSAPITVPLSTNMKFSQRLRGATEEQAPDMNNMAASIRALARSVRVDGTEMFGELPRPRYTSSTEKIAH